MQKEELIRAILLDNLPKVEDIIKNKGVDVNVDIDMGDTLLVYTIQQNKYDVFKKILELGADVNKTVPKGGYTDTPRNLTPLMVAVTSEDERFVTDLLDKGADVNAQDVEGMTALMYAYESDTDTDIESIIKRLIQAGANLELDDVNGEPVLFLAIRRAADYDSDHWLQLLFDAPTPPNVNHQNEFGSTPLHEAVRINYIPAIEYILNKGGDPNIQNNEGFPPMNIALTEDVSDEPSDIVELLLSKGAKTEFIQKTTNYEWSLLTTAINMGFEEAAEVLIDVPNVNVNMVDPSDAGNDDTPLMLAIRNDYSIEFIQKLLDKGADVNAENLDEDTPLLEAMYGDEHEIEIVRLLLDKGANINVQNEDGRTALMYAVINSHIESVKLLLERGANKTIEDENGKTALEYATSEEIRALLGGQPVGPVEMWKGYTQPDAEFFNAIVENEDSMNTKTFCPFCFEYTEWGTVTKKSCKYLSHICKRELRHERLYNLYKNTEGQVVWCAVCGRHCYGHGHFPLTDTNETTRPNLIAFKPGADVYKADSCPLEGGGGPDEKLRRVDGLLRYICQVQEDVDKRPAKEVRDELIEEAWKAAGTRAPKTVRDIRASNKFNIPCGLPSVSIDTSEAPDLPNPNPMPVEKGPGTSSISLDDCDQTYEFVHKQPDGSMFTHQLVCKADIRDILKNSGGTEEKCPIEPECNGKLHPDEIKDMFADEPDIYKEYRRRFNEKNKVGGKKKKQSRRKTRRVKKFRGGADGTPIVSKMTDAQCAMPEKKTAGRKTFRRKLRATRKRRYTRR
jgi:ankyrin repeat protein